MKQYTVGFVFDSTLENVLLIHKNRPEWQKGKLNGPGGKIDGNETPFESISREINEETNLSIPPQKWTMIAEIGNDDWHIYFMSAIYPNQLTDVISMTDEKVEWYRFSPLPQTIIDDLSWILPLCHKQLSQPDGKIIKVRRESRF